MTLELIIPEIGKSTKVKDLIISILIDYPYQTLTQIHRTIKRKYGINTSFQAVIKATKILIEHNVIINNNKKYTINIDWIQINKEFFDKLYDENIRKNKKKMKILQSNNVTVYKVNNLFELDKLWWDLLVNWAAKEKYNKLHVWKGQHMWWLMPRIQTEESLREVFSKYKIKTYQIIENNTFLDKLAKDYYIGKKEHIKIISEKKDLDEEISVFGDIILRFKRPKIIKDKIKEIYKNKNIDLKKIIDLFSLEKDIELTVIKDKDIATNMINNIISKFK